MEFDGTDPSVWLDAAEMDLEIPGVEIGVAAGSIRLRPPLDVKLRDGYIVCNVASMRESPPATKCLQEFRELKNQGDARIRDFVEKWGVLDLENQPDVFLTFDV